MSDFKAKMHQFRCPPRISLGSLQGRGGKGRTGKRKGRESGKGGWIIMRLRLRKVNFLVTSLLMSSFIDHEIEAVSVKGKASPYSITERRVPELIPVLGSQPAGDVNHKPVGRLPLLSARPVVTLATLKRAATNFAAW